MRKTIIQGDALTVLRQLPTGVAQCAVTSPPYYQLRSYLPDGHHEKHREIGLEDSPEDYITRLVEVFREVRRILRPDGVLWINIGDSYAEKTRAKTMHQAGADFQRPSYDQASMPARNLPPELPAKNLMMMPARLALALQADGWILRADCIWAKTNAMPESVRDRPAKSHEYLFLLATSERYFYDVEATRQPLKEKTMSTWGCKVTTRGGDQLGKVKSENWAKTTSERKPRMNADGSIAGAAMRSVIHCAGARYKGAHFATFPPQLIAPLIAASSSPRACEHCGAPWARTIERTPMEIRPGPKAGSYGSRTTDGLSGTMLEPARAETTGWRATCLCKNEGSARCLVLDPFIGAGTTGLVAQSLGRDYLGIELSAEYIRLAEQRIAEAQPV